jgi:hypothetical protein
MTRAGWMRILAAAAAWSATGAPLSGIELPAGERVLLLGEPIYRENFEQEQGYWVEGNPAHAHLQDGRLILDGNVPGEPVVTVFIDREFSGNLYFEYEAEILASDTAPGFPPPADVNNLNTFLYYSHPSADLKQTAPERADGAYRHYHDLNGYIVTFLNGHIAQLREKLQGQGEVTVSPKTGRVRMRENPGFVLKAEEFRERSEIGRRYKLQFAYLDGELFFFIDDQLQLSFAASPDRRFGRGYFAFRTFATRMAVDSFEVRNVHLSRTPETESSHD